MPQLDTPHNSHYADSLPLRWICFHCQAVLYCIADAATADYWYNIVRHSHTATPADMLPHDVIVIADIVFLSFFSIHMAIDTIQYIAIDWLATTLRYW